MGHAPQRRPRWVATTAAAKGESDARTSATLRAVLALSLVTIGLGVAAPTVGAQGPALDTVRVTGSAGDVRNIDVTAQAEPSGANASGTASFGVFLTDPRPGILTLSGPVTCLSVTGPDLGAGRPGAPTVAVLTFVDPNFESTLGGITIQVVDNGGGGADQIGTSPLRSPSDCSPLGSLGLLTNGRAVVFDAPLVPTSKADCKHGGWRDFGSMFRNQGQCIAFVNHQRHKSGRG